jgi:PAS domain S-box-containing protein
MMLTTGQVRVDEDREQGELPIGAAPIHDVDGEIVGGVVTYRDDAEQPSGAYTARLLADASDALTTSLDYEATLERVARMVVPTLAEMCLVDTIEADGELRRIVGVHADPEGEALLQEMIATFPPSPDGMHPVREVMLTKQPRLIPRVTDDMLDAIAQDSRHRDLLRQLDIRSGLTVPIITRGVTLGAIELLRSESRAPFGDDDLIIAQELARRAAQAVDNARLYNEVQQSRERLRAQAARTAALAEASRVFAEAVLDRQAVLDTVAHQVGELLGDLCVIRLLSNDGEQLVPAAVYHPDSEAVALARAVLRDSDGRADEGNAGQVLRSGEPILLSAVTDQDAAGFDPANRPYVERYGVRSLMMVPLHARGRVIGVISVAREQPGQAYVQDDLDFLQELANRAALAVDNARLYGEAQTAEQATRRQAARMRVLAEVSGALAEAGLDISAVLAAVAQHVAEQVGDGCSIRLLSNDRRWLTAVALHHTIGEAATFMREEEISEPLPAGLGLHGQVVSGGQALQFSGLSREALRRSLASEYHAYIDRYGMHSITIVPLRAQGRVIGTLGAWRDATSQPYTVADREFLQELADRAGIAIQNARLYQDVQQAETRYRNLFEAAADAILVIDANGSITDVNPAAVELFGYTSDELQATRVESLALRRQDWGDQEWQHWLASGGHVEIDMRRRDNSIVPVEAWVREIRLPTGVAYLANIRDISERRRLDRMQQEFVAMVTHELKGPLTSLKGFAQLMQRRGAYNERGVEVILAQAGHLERLISDLLDTARLDAGRLDLRRASSDLVALVLAAAEQAQASTQQHLIQVDSAYERLVGNWDADRITQVLLNLLSNAIKYSPDGGGIIVRVDDLGDTARVSVTDRGAGIPAESLPRLFSRFYRVESNHGSVQGMGLGLYISRSLIEAHGGQIWCESILGQGSTFTVTLPYSGTRTEG